MNREILFKAKRKDNGEWVEGDLIREQDIFGKINTRIYQMKGDGAYQMHEVDPDTICQCIERTTEQGKAWEHDLIRLQSGEICEIVYDRNECAWCAASIKDTTKYILLKYALVTEYIGSKFDHLELIGGAS